MQEPVSGPKQSLDHSRTRRNPKAEKNESRTVSNDVNPMSSDTSSSSSTTLNTSESEDGGGNLETAILQSSDADYSLHHDEYEDDEDEVVYKGDSVSSPFI